MNVIPFSVAMCVYGGDNPDWFKIAVDSILDQTAKPNEVVLVVDGPVSDELLNIIDSYEKMPQFKVIRFEVNQGHGNARRAGLEACSNDLVAIMDADDISIPRRFELQLSEFIDNPDVDIVGGNIREFIDNIDNSVGRRIVPETDGAIKEYMKSRCPMNLVTVMFRKESVLSVGGFIDWYCEEDYYLWLRMAFVDKVFANIPEDIVNVRVGSDMYKRRGGWKYFKSEYRLQRYMLKNEFINGITFFANVSKRLIVQVLMPNKIRGWVFKTFARE